MARFGKGADFLSWFVARLCHPMSGDARRGEALLGTDSLSPFGRQARNCAAMRGRPWCGTARSGRVWFGKDNGNIGGGLRVALSV